MSIDPGEAELASVRSQFCTVIARWRLTQADLRALLGQTAGPFVEGRVLPDEMTSDAERRMRLLVRLDSGLERRFASDDVALRIRQSDSFGRTPLQLLADLADLRLAVMLAERGPSANKLDPFCRVQNFGL